MKFVVVASNRTGSTHLTNLLNSHQEIICHGELFKPYSRSGRYGLRWPKEDKSSDALGDFMDLRERDPQRFLARIFAQDYGAAAVGFKIFGGQNDAVLDLLISDASVRKVVLLRRNVLAVYSSNLIARELGTHNFKAGSQQPVSAPAVKFRPNAFRRFCGQYLGFYRSVFERLLEVRQAYHLVSYDQINDPWLHANLVVLIGGSPPNARPKARFVKQNSSNILSRFSNPDEADSFLEENGLTDWRCEPETSLDPFAETVDDGSRRAFTNVSISQP